MSSLQEEREREYQRAIRRERNALTLMPLPVSIPAAWYDLMERVAPLIKQIPQTAPYFMPHQTLDAFLNTWKARLMRRDGNHVWVYLGGLECYDMIPAFSRSLERSIKGFDQDLKVKGGLKATIELWRRYAIGLNNLNDIEVLDARRGMLHSLEALMSTITLSGCWAAAFERARDNILKIRPTVYEWIRTQGRTWDLDQPFGGKVQASITERMS